MLLETSCREGTEGGRAVEPCAVRKACSQAGRVGRARRAEDGEAGQMLWDGACGCGEDMCRVGSCLERPKDFCSGGRLEGMARWGWCGDGQGVDLMAAGMACGRLLKLAWVGEWAPVTDGEPLTVDCVVEWPWVVVRVAARHSANGPSDAQVVVVVVEVEVVVHCAGGAHFRTQLEKLDRAEVRAVTWSREPGPSFPSHSLPRLS